VVVDASDVRLDELCTIVERTFRHVAESRTLDFTAELDPLLPPSIFTDAKRLQQILKNLLSNAFKFTPHGRVSLRVGPAGGGRDREPPGAHPPRGRPRLPRRGHGPGHRP